jgi:hypothetical protein
MSSTPDGLTGDTWDSHGVTLDPRTGRIRTVEFTKT